MTQGQPAPVWLQRMSLFVLVLFCIYLGVILTALPWWPAIWERNVFLLAHPHLRAVAQMGPVRGVVSGLGLLDIWIGISEAIGYRDYRADKASSNQRNGIDDSPASPPAGRI